jgi:PAS domain S-box-containing protein
MTSADGLNDLASRMLVHIARIHRQTIVEQSPVKALNLVLQAVLDVTESQFGFVGEVLHDEQGQPFLRSYAVTNIGWNEEMRSLYERYITTGLEFRNLDTLFGHVLRTRQTLLANDAQHHPAAGGLPPGHPPLESFAGIVINVGDEMVGMCGLANRPGGYDEALLETIRPILSAAGMMISGLRVMRDLDAVRSRAQHEAGLRKAMIQAAGECVVIVDADARIVEFNPAASARFGWAESEVLGLSASALLAATEDRPAYDELLRHGAAEPRTVELRAVQRDGQVLLVEITVARMSSGEEIRTTRGKMSFIAVVSHEIRTPLATIASALDLLSTRTLDAEARGYLEAAQAASESLIDLVGRVLDYSRIEAQEEKLTPDAVFTPDALLRAIGTQFKPAAEAQGLSLVVECDINPSLRVTGDEIRVRQILSNLVSNAIKFTPQGTVRLLGRTDVIAPGWHRLIVDVLDTGIGMSAEFCERLFAQFAQADTSLSRARSGTGLGLAISRGLATRMGGSLELVGTSAAGSHFQLRLDLHEAPAEPVPVVQAGAAGVPDEAVSEPAALHRILVIDDNLTNLSLLRRQLERSGFEVTTASNGYDALSLLALRNQDIALMDLEMPGMDGLEVVRRHRQIEREEGCKPLPIVALTGHAPVEYRVRALEAGMDDFMTKPYRINELLARLRTAAQTASSKNSSKSA